MQFEKANALKNATSEEEKKNCNHSYEKEYYLSADTGDYVCTKCGHTLWKPDYEEWLKNQKQ
jgi:hypothetical protein